MRNDLFYLPGALRIPFAIALLLASACGRTGELTLIVDSSWSGDGLEVILLPVDPAPILRENSPHTTAGQADSLATLTSLEQVADSLDREFTRLRDNLNEEAESLSRADRRSNQYAERYDEFQPRAARADSVRAARDKVRARTSAYRTALAPFFPDSARIREEAAKLRSRLNAVRDGGRSARTVTISAQSGNQNDAASQSNAVTVRLDPGQWWAGVAREGPVPLAFQTTAVEKGMRDTLRLRQTRRN